MAKTILNFQFDYLNPSLMGEGGAEGGGSPIYKLLVSPDQTVDGSGNPGAGAQVDITALNFLVFIV